MKVKKNAKRAKKKKSKIGKKAAQNYLFYNIIHTEHGGKLVTFVNISSRAHEEV